jgi:hypothetical protein
MRLIILSLVLVICSNATGQVSSTTQKALNAYSSYASRSGEEVADVVE